MWVYVRESYKGPYLAELASVDFWALRELLCASLGSPVLQETCGSGIRLSSWIQRPRSPARRLLLPFFFLGLPVFYNLLGVRRLFSRSDPEVRVRRFRYSVPMSSWEWDRRAGRRGNWRQLREAVDAVEEIRLQDSYLEIWAVGKVMLFDVPPIISGFY
ncbi:hypothetical protein NDU88_005455 [Pleurodeles waltl]|uniref:Uncharacterized protein n=1 Tax=Pleurodeles waltl TaxID=8319 RepID=A0AAV7WBH6_PLEWA|nr:hypothetical protein NDU88_005455 [Pleurodeles waltl]